MTRVAGDLRIASIILKGGQLVSYRYTAQRVRNPWFMPLKLPSHLVGEL